MSSDYAEDLAYDMARAERFLQPHEDDEEEEMSRVYLGPTRRTPITEDWLMAQEDLRQTAVRNLRVSRLRRMRRALELSVVWILAMGAGAAVLAGLYYAAQWLWGIL